MTSSKTMLLRLIVLVAVAIPCLAEEVTPPKISDFLADTGATYVGAAGIINLDDKLVTNVSSPKDFVLSVGQGKADDSKNGFGVAYAPGRAKFTTFAVDITQYGNAEPAAVFSMEGYQQRWRRLLNSATISYAQNTRTLDSVDYRQRAAALHVEYFYKYNDDPTVAAYQLIAGVPGNDGGKSCKQLADLRAAARSRAVVAAAANAPKDLLVRVLAPEPAAADASPPAAPNLAQEHKRAAEESLKARRAKKAPVAAAAAAEAASRPMATSLAQSDRDAAAKAVAAATATVGGETVTSEDLERLAQECADEALAASRAKWNATKFTLLVGKGDIRGPNADDPRLSLGQQVQLGFQIGPDFWNNTLFTFTARHTARALNIDSLASTPTYSSGMLWAARATYGFGADRTLYGVAEVSDARSKNAGVAAGAFKYALGLDKRLADSMWFELRLGRAVLRSGETSETKVMANAKFSFDSELAGLARK